MADELRKLLVFLVLLSFIGGLAAGGYCLAREHPSRDSGKGPEAEDDPCFTFCENSCRDTPQPCLDACVATCD